MTQSAGEQRITRLVGDGKASGGGALPLSDAFRGVMEQILDEGSASYKELVKRITDEMHTKERRIIAIWGSWNSFTDDIIQQLCDRRLIRPEHDPEDDLSGAGSWMSSMRWLLGEDVRAGGSYEAITAREVRKATGNKEAQPFRVVLYDRETRADRDNTALALTATHKWRHELERRGKMGDRMIKVYEDAVAELEGKRAEGHQRPPKPDDQPEIIVYCKVGGEPLTKTKDNFTVYWSRDQWYWRTSCREHSTGAHTRQQKLAETINAMIEENDGAVPSAKSVMRRLGKKDDKVLRGDWDVLYDKGLVPARPTV